MYDPPHLLKSVRNNLKNHGIYYEDTSIGNTSRTAFANWKHIEELYEMDSKDVLSHSVAAALNLDGEPPFERDFRVYPLNPEIPQQPFININILSPNLDTMAYPILFPYGETGWQPNWRCESYQGAQGNQSRVNVTMLQYKSALTAVRDDFNPLISAGKLMQQWSIYSYLKVEENNLNFIRTHQQQLQTELYQGLADHFENAAQNAVVKAGIQVILPSSFEGSPRNMRERCADAISIFGKYGAPDLFITVTANSYGQKCVRPSKHTTEHPDLLVRVFNLKFQSLMDDLTVHGVLGKSIAHVYTVEFQKSGLPHAHILIVLRADDKFSTSEHIDQFVRAEIPSSIENPRLYEILTN
ncbi:hypothetical protein AVEN_153497-1 [Araneus ventricosus]|uniref:Helitron helicase-like domain-containing protein n=1 Tax=Araneus ventricosus TaxID=182803 RepID=A0A4Y2K7E4_ARAVE|nr:hypothetical protein AVEN_153497-1 [Araneus ventricosus]